MAFWHVIMTLSQCDQIWQVLAHLGEFQLSRAGTIFGGAVSEWV